MLKLAAGRSMGRPSCAPGAGGAHTPPFLWADAGLRLPRGSSRLQLRPLLLQLRSASGTYFSAILNFLATGLRNVLRRQGFYNNGAFPGSHLSSLPPQLPNPPSPRPVKGLVRPLRLPSCRVAQDFDTSARGMSSTLARNEEKKGSRPSQPTTPATSLGCDLKVSRSEEFLTQISTELTDEALFVAAYHMNPVPIKEKQTQDRGTQISKHVFFTKTRDTDTRSNRNGTRTKTHLLPSPREKGPLPTNLTSGG
ncbi:uncharacterized protein LOC129637652 [Bubalus kerabau]|nr:uncharacterized protein LOC129637652 [Bubalus carabanensis]